METKKRDHALDLLKFIATIAVVLHHYERSFGLHFETLNFADGRFYFGWMAELFFMVSGYLALNSVEKIRNGLSFDKYFSAKYLRSIPLAALSTAVITVLYVVAAGGNGFSLFPTLAIAFGFNPGIWITELILNMHLWYLSVLLICYAVFFVMIRLAQRWRINWIYGCFFMIVLGVSAYSALADLPFLNQSISRGYMAFFTGLMLASLLKEHRPGTAAGITSLIILIVSVLILVFRFDLLEYRLVFYLLFIFYPALIVLLETPAVQKILDHRFLGRLAQISFNVYIWHYELCIICAYANSFLKLGVDFSSRAAEMMFLILALAVGAASHFVIEKPINALINRKMTRSTAEG